MKYLVFLKDIDPDTGKISQLVRLCECDSADVAKSICWSMNMGDESPNREYYSEPLYKDRTVLSVRILRLLKRCGNVSLC